MFKHPKVNITEIKLQDDLDYCQPSSAERCNRHLRKNNIEFGDIVGSSWHRVCGMLTHVEIDEFHSYAIIKSNNKSTWVFVSDLELLYKPNSNICN
jgi:hypothetical protein